MSGADAERAARKRLGSVLKQKEAGHEIRTGQVAENLLRDVRHMGRGLGRTPGFTLAVILTLALGIGANTAIFSIVDQLLLRPLPYPEGDNLVMVYEARNSNSHNSVSPATWLDWQRDTHTLERVAAWVSGRAAILTDAGEAIRLGVQPISAEFFPLLSVPPMLGRIINEDDDRPNAPVVAVISHHLWQTRFGGDRNVVGRFIQLDDTPTQVVGVMPPGFRFVFHDIAVWVPLQLDRNAPWREAGGRSINVVARVKTGTALETARADMEQVARRLASLHEFNKNSTARLVPLREELAGQLKASLIVLYIAVGLLLAIACFNIANLLIARAASRRQEIGIRTSLGAERGAIVRQLLVESMLLALAGGTLGIVLARSSLDALVAFAPPALLRGQELTIDARVLLYVAGLSVLTGLVAGLAPAVIVARRPVVESLRASSSRVTHSPRLRQLLVVGQVAMTVVLLCGAALLVRTVTALTSVNHGFEQQGLLTLQVSLPGTRYPIERQVAFQQELLMAIRELPGVDSAGAASSLPVIGAPRAGTRFHRLSTPVVPPTQMSSATIRVVTPGYFRTLRIPVLRGREFAHADDTNPAPGFIVNQEFVDRYLPNVDPLRESLMVRMRDENPYAPIIGVVGNVGEGSMRSAPRPTIFYNHSQLPLGPTLLVRTDRAVATAEAVTSVIRRMDPNLVIRNVRTFEEAVAESLAQERLTALVSGGFAVSALLLASLGVYALLAFMVSERRREIGLRMALGADGGALIRSVVARGLRLVAIGSAVGVAFSLVALPSLRTLLFGVTPNDSETYALVLSLLMLVSGVASYLPARHAARVEPLVALRQD
jgi:putative ABC transport system permease protein